jgi:hypothetical protein
MSLIVIIIRPDANIKFKVSAIPKCQYKNKFLDFTCDEPPEDAGGTFCIFHDINYLKGNSYKINKAVKKKFN